VASPLISARRFLQGRDFQDLPPVGEMRKQKGMAVNLLGPILKGYGRCYSAKPGLIQRNILPEAGRHNDYINALNQYLQDVKACNQAYVPGPERDACIKLALEKLKLATGKAP